jgi:indolepyruvate ferredoxin oxidoreductase alpha subunit
MTLAVDASFAVQACGIADGFDVLGQQHLVAPPLMWSEARSAIREALWRGEVTSDDATTSYQRLATCPVERVDHPDLHMETWRIAAEFGWTKTYDAEYVALARILACQLITLDMRLHRGTKRLGFVVTPKEL